MIDLDRWREIGESLTRHKLRTALTMLSVAWGTFILVVLLGAGRGLQNNVEWEFRDDATNSIWIYRGETSRPYAGHPVGRRIQMTNDDYDLLVQTLDVEHATARFYLEGRSATAAWQGRSASFGVRAVHPDHRYLENSLITAGRYIDELDLLERRKVAVIGTEVARFLFRGADPIGEWIDVARVPFRVVGVFDDTGGESETSQIYLPITTAQASFGGERRIHQLMFTVGDASVAEATAMADQLQQALAARHHFDPQDGRALRVRNNVEQFERITRIFRLLDAFVWLVGIGTVTAGIVGVSNIMLVVVRERTAEIGLRKALGATPGSIVGGIVQEAVLMTAVSGYLGIVAGVGLLEVLRAWLPDNPYLRDPEVTLWPAVVAALLLVAFGGLAGFVPAWRAARIHPVEALRDA